MVSTRDTVAWNPSARQIGAEVVVQHAAETRDDWLVCSDRQLLRQCDVHRFRASGPGGQHRNKTDSAVRLRHRPTGITVVAVESRSQHENRTRAIRRLREAIALQVRCRQASSEFRLPESLSDAIVDGRIVLPKRDPRRLLLLAWALDAVATCEGRLQQAAALFGLTTSRLVAFLKQEPKHLAAANAIREQFGLGSLR